jgi:hypothetical protein
MSGTTVYYNGVLMQDCELKEWNQVIEYDESKTDVKFSRIRVTAASTLVSIMTTELSSGFPLKDDSRKHNSTIELAEQINQGYSMPDRIGEIQMRLQVPRQDFWLAFHGTAGATNNDPLEPVANPTDRSEYRLALAATGIFPRNQTEESDVSFSEYVKSLEDINLSVKRADVIDANNGPKPEGISVTQVFGGQALRVEVSFEICRAFGRVVETGDEYTSADPLYDAQKVTGVVSNRWSVTDSMDEQGAVTHVIEGKMTVRDQRFKAMYMRMYCWAYAFPFARMTQRSFQVDPTGLVLAYQLQFSHAGSAPPFGVRDYSATYVESLKAGKIGLQQASMDINVKGWYDGSAVNPENSLLTRFTEQEQKAILLRGAISILHSRLRGINTEWVAAAGEKVTETILENAQVIERHGRPELTLRVNVYYKRKDGTEFPLRLAAMGRPISNPTDNEIPNYDPRWWPVDSTFGKMNFDSDDNPNFYNQLHPESESGDSQASDYFQGYFQLPDGQRHSLPRLNSDQTKTIENGPSARQWALPNGHFFAGVSPSLSSEQPDYLNPQESENAPSFYAIPNRDLKGELTTGPLPLRTNADRSSGDTARYTGISDKQLNGFTYMKWESEIKHDGNEGIVFVPLSKARDVNNQSGSTGDIKPKQTAVAIRLHAGVSHRVYSVTAERVGKWPEIPEPMRTIVRNSGFVAESSGDPEPDPYEIVETLLKKEVITETPTLMNDQNSRLFTLHCRWTYGLSRPWGGNSDQGGWDNDFLPVGESPIDRATIAVNKLKLRRLESDNPLTVSAMYDPDVPTYG